MMIYWVVITPKTVGIFRDFNLLIHNYDNLKDFIKPFTDFYEAYTYMCKELAPGEYFSLGVEDYTKLVVDKWIIRTMGLTE